VSSVVPIPKSATGTENLSNYRPTSLLSVASKLLEKHIYGILFEQLEERELLSVAPEIHSHYSQFKISQHSSISGIEVSIVF